MNKNFMGEIDRFDWAILDILQKDNTTSQREIADRVNLSTAAVHRRIKRMNENGTIESNVAVINPAIVSRPITLILEIELEKEQVDLLDEIKQMLPSLPEVQQCYYVTGNADFILIITLPSMADFEPFTRRLLANNIKRVKTFVTIDRVKVSLQVPLTSK